MIIERQYSLTQKSNTDRTMNYFGIIIIIIKKQTAIENIFFNINHWFENCSSWSLLLIHDIFSSDDPVWKAVEMRFLTIV